MRFALKISALVVLTAASLVAQTAFKPWPILDANWTKPFPPCRIVGNLYYVGTYDLASYLITTNAGHILINTGVYGSVPLIRSSIESLGFKFEDVKILVATHGHYDHVAGLAEVKRLTGARMFMHEGDAGVLEDGGSTQTLPPSPSRDPSLAVVQGRPHFEPVKVDRRLKHGDVIRLGGTELTAHHHPGHTKGSTSFSFTTRNDSRSYRVLVVNMANTAGERVLAHPTYPNRIRDFELTFARQKQLSPDVWVTSHAGRFGLHKKHSPEDAYNPNRFVDPEGYRSEIQQAEQVYLDQIKKERQETPGEGLLK